MNLNEKLCQQDLLNQDELNQVCLSKLPPDWRSPTGLYCLGLARWGITTLDVPLLRTGPDVDEMIWMIDQLETWSPQAAYNWLICPEGSDGEDVLIAAEDLKGLDSDAAAMAIVELLRSQMATRRP